MKVNTDQDARSDEGHVDAASSVASTEERVLLRIEHGDLAVAINDLSPERRSIQGAASHQRLGRWLQPISRTEAREVHRRQVGGDGGPVFAGIFADP